MFMLNNRSKYVIRLATFTCAVHTTPEHQSPDVWVTHVHFPIGSYDSQQIRTTSGECSMDNKLQALLILLSLFTAVAIKCCNATYANNFLHVHEASYYLSNLQLGNQLPCAYCTWIVKWCTSSGLFRQGLFQSRGYCMLIWQEISI